MFRKRYRKCTICGKQKLPTTDMLLSSFPLDPDQCRLWVKASGEEDFVHVPIEKLHELKFICGSHFARKYFNANGNRLLCNAVPTLGLTRPPLSDDLLTEFPLHVASYYDKKKSEVPSTSTSTAVLEVVGQSFSVDAIIDECNIPTIGCTIEVNTSEHQQGYLYNNSTGKLRCPTCMPSERIDILYCYCSFVTYRTIPPPTAIPNLHAQCGD